jgi:hypothetical protein
MPKLVNQSDTEIMDLVLDFAGRLSAAVDRASIARVRDVLDIQLGSPPVRPNHNAPAPTRKSWTSLADVRAAFPSAIPGSIGGKPPRKKPPRQLCPVPGCKNTAAPVYDMVCADHKDVPKTKIEKYRKARRAEKEREASKPSKAKG